MATLRLACPRCHEALDQADDGLRCRLCAELYPCRDGVHRCLLAPESELTRRFHAQYAAVRERDGSRRYQDADYRRLPEVDKDDPRAGEWRVRRESYAALCHALERARERRGASTRIAAADLGAGNGWLSYRLEGLGCDVVAVDRLDDERDGLGACLRLAPGIICAQADFDALPLASGSIDVVVLNGSLHYSQDPRATLAEARRVLADGGALVVMDSPIFSRPEDGEAMVSAQQQSFRRDYGVRDVVRPGVGFLTFDGLRSATGALGLNGRFIPSRGPLGWRVRRAVARVRLRRVPAAFGVWVAQ